MLAALQKELFRTLLMQSVEFFDRHDPTDLTALLSVELNSLRTFVFKCGFGVRATLMNGWDAQLGRAHCSASAGLSAARHCCRRRCDSPVAEP